MKRVAARVATEGKHQTAIQRTIRGYTLCKIHGQRSQLWRGIEASHCSHALRPLQIAELVPVHRSHAFLVDPVMCRHIPRPL